MKQLHAEYAPEVSYTRFRRRLRVKASSSPAIAIRLEHKPGERTQINYCDGIAIVDRATGERRKTHLFCGVLPFSSFAFAEFVESQKLASFIESHERMWAAGPTRGGGRRSRTGPRPEHWANLQSGRRVRWRRGAAGARAWWRAASGWRATFPEQRRRRNGACRWRWR